MINPDFTASTSKELKAGIKPALLHGKVPKRVATEKLQMTRLLEVLAETQVIQYPLHVKHTTEFVPDFQLLSGGRRVSVELTRIKFQDIEHGRAIQQEVKRTISVTRLFPKEGGPRRKQEIINDGYGLPVFLFPSCPDEEELIWLNQAEESLMDKSHVLSRGDYVRGDENWLVLLDPVGTIHSDIKVRMENVSLLLDKFWSAKWFSRVFLQDTCFEWQMMFSQRERSIISCISKEPPPHLLGNDFHIDESLLPHYEADEI
jgi:hypothetical protein